VGERASTFGLQMAERGCSPPDILGGDFSLTKEQEIHNPPHYVEGREIEPIQVIEDWELDHHLAAALKYISRAGRKDRGNNNGLLIDLGKAVWYLERRIFLEELRNARS
jgi:hypothetical protein